MLKMCPLRLLEQVDSGSDSSKYFDLNVMLNDEE